MMSSFGFSSVIFVLKQEIRLCQRYRIVIHCLFQRKLYGFPCRLDVSYSSFTFFFFFLFPLQAHFCKFFTIRPFVSLTFAKFTGWLTFTNSYMHFSQLQAVWVVCQVLFNKYMLGSGLYSVWSTIAFLVMVSAYF